MRGVELDMAVDQRVSMDLQEELEIDHALPLEQVAATIAMALVEVMEQAECPMRMVQVVTLGIVQDRPLAGNKVGIEAELEDDRRHQFDDGNHHHHTEEVLEVQGQLKELISP